MTKNLMPIIAKELGVEIGEEFKIEDSDWLYRFSKERLERRFPTSCEWNESTMTIGNLQDIEIVKLPFEPKYGEEYWTYFGKEGTDGWGFYQEIWDNSVLDYIYKYAGCIFRTQKDAVAALPAKYKELTGKEWKE